MTDYPVTVPVEALKAAATLAPKSDVRYYLQSVCVERTEDGNVFVVATDGHALSAQRIEQNEPTTGHAFQCLLPLPAVKVLPKTGLIELTYLPAEDETSTARYSMRIGAGSWADYVQPSKFPDWRRVVPRSASDEPAQFDPEVLQRLQKAARMAYSSPRLLIQLHHNGESGTLVSFVGCEDWMGVAMPCRLKYPLVSVDSITAAFLG